jgi:predicted Fe-Mo cluster-binding NifX family protein
MTAVNDDFPELELLYMEEGPAVFATEQVGPESINALKLEGLNVTPSVQ